MPCGDTVSAQAAAEVQQGAKFDVAIARQVWVRRESLAALHSSCKYTVNWPPWLFDKVFNLPMRYSTASCDNVAVWESLICMAHDGVNHPFWLYKIHQQKERR